MIVISLVIKNSGKHTPKGKENSQLVGVLETSPGQLASCFLLYPIVCTADYGMSSTGNDEPMTRIVVTLPCRRFEFIVLYNAETQ